ncbi:MAG: hypothetical protein P4L91_06495 [Burkholderiaceae bacterium]|nr:hypothetical protein [Burkholderiaceae bacterium]
MNTATHIEPDLITKLAEALASHMRPAIPISIDLWDIATIAAYLKRDPQVVRERMACLPSFPKAIRLPTTRGRAQALYNALEVIKWAQSHQDKH